MEKKLIILKKIRDVLIRYNQPKYRCYTMQEKKEMALRGEDIPFCIYNLNKRKTKSIIPIRHVPNNELKKLNLKL